MIVIVFLLEASVVIVYPENSDCKEKKKIVFSLFFSFFHKKPLVTRVGGERMLEVFGVGGWQGN